MKTKVNWQYSVFFPYVITEKVNRLIQIENKLCYKQSK